MNEIIFHSSSGGNEPLAEYIKDLRQKAVTDKDARIRLIKIIAYIDLLEEYGTQVGEPVVKHLKDSIWELQPLRIKILFSRYKDNIYILLHHTVKNTDKTPLYEITYAERNLIDFIERSAA